jgi:hypothetical protein
MVLRDPLLRLKVAPHVTLLGIAAAHGTPPRECEIAAIFEAHYT